MKYLLSILLLNSLFSSVALGKANCSNSAVAAHNWQCAGTVTDTGIHTLGKTPDKTDTNSQLGAGASRQPPVVQVQPLPPTVITGTSLVTLKDITAKPHTFTGQRPVQVNPTPTPPLNGISAVPVQQVVTAKPQTFTGQNVQVNPTPTPILTGTSPVPPQPVIIAPPKTFTGQNIQVNPTPTPILTGTSPVPQQPVIIAPPKTFTGQNVQVNPTPTPIITGTSAVPSQPPTTSTLTPQQNVYPVPTPIFIGTKPVSTPPSTNVSPVPGTQTSNNVPPMVTTTPVVTQSPAVAPKNPPVIITHVASNNLHPDVLLQQQMLHGSTDLKSLEPHIKDLPTDVYTDKNSHNTTYGKSSSIDSKGFHLTIVGGIKEPTFVDTSPLPVTVSPDDIIFNFNYASAEIHKDQLSQIDKVIAKHSTNGKKIILMGETDGFGSEEYNKHLALLRAHKIIDELNKRGAKTDDIEIRILVRCCRKGHPTKETLAETTTQRITWVHFQ